MGQFKDILEDKLVATDALLFYKNSNKNVKAHYYIEHRPIKDGQMGAGEPLELKTIAKLLRKVEELTLADSETLHGVMPPNLLYADCRAGSRRMVWYRPPEERMMYFTEEAGIPDGKMSIPGVVYSCTDRGLSVYVFKGRKPKDILYKAPFYNVSGAVCLGSAKLPKPKEATFENWMKYWEDMFWRSKFAYILGGNPIKGNLALITKECIQTGKPFPMSELLKAPNNLKSILK